MKYLLDTHTFLWTICDSDQLSEKAKEKIKNINNDVFVSAVSLWEISIKAKLGKLKIDGFKIEALCDLAEKLDVELIGLSPEEAISYHALEAPSHKDPFDRMLIWQSIKREMILISKDSKFKYFKKYGLNVLW